MTRKYLTLVMPYVAVPHLKPEHIPYKYYDELNEMSIDELVELRKKVRHLVSLSESYERDITSTIQEKVA